MTKPPANQQPAPSPPGADRFPVEPNVDWLTAETNLRLIIRRGVVAILSALTVRPHGHNELGRATQLDNRTLDRALLHLVDLGIVRRARRVDPQGGSEYSLTDPARSLVKPLQRSALAAQALSSEGCVAEDSDAPEDIYVT